MQFSEEWKSLFPISLVDSSPLLLSEDSLGPLCFNPVPETLALIASSPDYLSPHFLLPPPSVSLPRFLENTTLYHSTAAIPYTTSTSISTLFGPHHLHNSSGTLRYNHLEPLHCPNNWVLVFFPTGSNLDRVGFVVLTVKDSNVSVVEFNSPDPFFATSIKFDHRVVRLAAFPLMGSNTADVGSSGSIGFLLACTMYSAHWFSVRISGNGSDEKPELVYMGSKLFKSCAVAYACWNPHLPGECVVLLESGALFLFDMDSSCFKGKRMTIVWNEVGVSAQCGWFCCEFSWHPRILIVANSKAVFLLDFRFGKCRPCCLLKIEMLGMYDVVENDQFVAFSKAGDDGFFFTVASKHWLVLCDVRKPKMPVLRWVHNLHEPYYMIVLSLCDLRLDSLDEEYVRASEMGYAVVIGSFWHNEFNVFCYGRPPPATTKSLSAKMVKFCDSVYAWKLPSDLTLSGRSCGCGSCLLKEESLKDDLLEWLEWQQKKELVLGFFLLNKDLSLSLPRPGKHGGFTLVRLMSSGKLETQQFCASWEVTRTMGSAHQEATRFSKDSLLCCMGDEEYKYTKKFKYVNLEYLYAHLNDILAKSLFSSFKKPPSNANTNDCSDERFRDFMSTKLMSLFGCDPPISDLSASDVFRDVNMPTSLHEIGDKLMWIGLPMNTLELAYFRYDKFVDEKLSLEFPVIPDRNQAPPFLLRTSSHLGNKKSSKMLHGNDFVGPVVPLSAVLVLWQISRYGHSFIARVNEYSPDEATTGKCKSVMCIIKEMGIPNCSYKQDQEHAVSLENDKEEFWEGSSNSSSLFRYEPSACAIVSSFPDDGEDPEDSVPEGQTFNTVVAKLKSDDAKGPELYNDLCQVDLKFNCVGDQTSNDMEVSAYKLLKKQFSQWQDSFTPYQNLCDRLKPK